MKTLTIFSILILTSASASFASAQESNQATSNTASCDCTSVQILECMQSESQMIAETSSNMMTAMVLEKLRIADSARNESDLMDRLQKETEDISIVKPVLSIASFIEKQIERHQQKHQADTSMK